jgi:glycosyltransferase involved in cell wall biosynthesis
VRQRKRIAVNTRFLIKDKLEGIGYFTHETLKYITRKNPQTDFYFLFDRPFSSDFIYNSNIFPIVLWPPARHPFLWYWWFEVSVAKWLNKNKCDCFLSTDGFCSLNTITPTVAVMHDLAFEYYPKQMPLLTQIFYKRFMPLYAKQASRIATVSEFSKQDIVSHYHVSTKKVDVVYSAAKDIFHPVTENIRSLTKNKFSKGCNYLLYVGSVNGRKNLSKMLLAFDAFKQKQVSDLKFLVVGSIGWSNEEMQAAHRVMKHREEVFFLGRLEEDDLVAVIGSCLALMYVSLFEGFGVPPLEAMKCEVPCLTSTTSSMPEITAGAALTADPHSVNDIALKIEALYNDPQLREQLIQKGKVRASFFTWQKTAELLWDCCSKVLNNS